MKLYTEEQVRTAIAMGYDWCHQKHIPSDYMIDSFINSLTRIELPTDEEIESANPYRLGGENYNGAAAHKWQKGVEWVINKIEGGNK